MNENYELGDVIKCRDLDEARQLCINLEILGFNTRAYKAESFFGWEVIIVK